MGNTLRGAVSAWLALIVLQALVTKTDRVGGALAGLNGLVQRALSPNVPAIPDRRAGASSSADPYGGLFHGLTPAENQAINDAKNINPAALAALQQAGADPNSLLSQLANLNTAGLSNLGALNH